MRVLLAFLNGEKTVARDDETYSVVQSRGSRNQRRDSAVTESLGKEIQRIASLQSFLEPEIAAALISAGLVDPDAVFSNSWSPLQVECTEWAQSKRAGLVSGTGPRPGRSLYGRSGSQTVTSVMGD